MRWRSPAEIRYRLWQEARNLRLLANPPRLPDGLNTAHFLPDPGPIAAALRGTGFADEITAEAEQILAHRFQLLGSRIDAGAEILWRRDPQSGKETPPLYFRRIPYLDAARAGDHKIIWELNRHQHLVLLAQAWVLSGRAEFVSEIERQLDGWRAANPFHRGINWASALEVAFRALSWIWIDHLAGEQMSVGARSRLLEGLYQHGHHLAANLSFYFSPNTHLLGEAVALHAIGKTFTGSTDAAKWTDLGHNTVIAELARQVRADGSHFEQSSYYHVYALDMFLFHAILQPPDEHYRTVLAHMAEYLDALMGPARVLPQIGDDDGGRFFHPYGARDRFGRATLASCGVFLGRADWIADPADLREQCFWWQGPRNAQPAPARPHESKWFPDAGVAIMAADSVHAIADAGPFGPFRSGHSHADTLSIVIRRDDEDLLIDPGTFTYVGDPRWRDAFRGTAAHNTVRVGGLDQADPAGPFAWNHPPAVELRRWQPYFVDAECRYRGFTHRRRIQLVDAAFFLIADEIRGPEGEHEIEQFWHPAGDASCLVLEEPAEEIQSWRSPVFGCRVPARVFCVRRKTALPCLLGAAVLIHPGSSVLIEHTGPEMFFHLRRAGQARTVTMTL
jgi:hypothetical protein